MMGPLDRYDAFVKQQEPPNPGFRALKATSLERIILGCFKKVVLADVLIGFSLAAFNDRDILGLSPGELLLSLYVYYWVLFFDFSGYCDIAIGVGELFGFKVPENFNRPYLARNMQDFWQRWHMTLMAWLRDYVYTPVFRKLLDVGSTHVQVLNCASFFLTFLLAGVWHGEGWNFFLYGSLHGFAYMIWLTYKLWLTRSLGKERLKSYMKDPYIKGCAQLITFHYFLLSLVFFIDKHGVLVKWIEGRL